MIIDTNILIYAHDISSPFHSVIHTWWEKTVNSTTTLITLPHICIQGFIRITSNPKLTQQPFGVHEATDIINQLLQRANISALGIDKLSWELFTEFTRSIPVKNSLITDAFLAAIAMSRSQPLVTVDKDFFQFPGLTVINPLI